MKLTDREKELIKGMIQVQQNHVERCEYIQNPVAIKQKKADLERVALLERILDKDFNESFPT